MLHIYTAANDTMAPHYERFRAFLGVFMPNAQLRIIPFDDRFGAIAAMMQGDSQVTIVEPAPWIDRIGQALFAGEDYRPGVAAWKYFRKLNAFAGHRSDFVFLDINCLILTDLEPFFGGGRILDGGCLFGIRSKPDRSIRDPRMRDHLSMRNAGLGGGYNAAMMVARGGLLREDLATDIARPELRAAIGQAPEQGFLTLYMGFHDVAHQTIADFDNRLASIAGPSRFSDLRDGFLRAATGGEASRIKAVIKYPGPAIRPLPPLVARFFARRASRSGPPATALSP